MKSIVMFVCCLVVSSVYALEVESAADVCVKSASTWALKSEAKQSGVQLNKIKISEIQKMGSGANLYLTSVFVEGLNVGENTHWEIVGEFKVKDNSCKVLLGRSYWAHE